MRTICDDSNDADYADDDANANDDELRGPSSQRKERAALWLSSLAQQLFEPRRGFSLRDNVGPAIGKVLSQILNFRPESG